MCFVLLCVLSFVIRQDSALPVTKSLLGATNQVKYVQLLVSTEVPRGLEIKCFSKWGATWVECPFLGGLLHLLQK